MDANLEKRIKKRARLTAIILGITAILSIVLITIGVNKGVLADKLQKENEILKSEIQLLKKENAELKK
jgi:hypothetical protein